MIVQDMIYRSTIWAPPTDCKNSKLVQAIVRGTPSLDMEEMTQFYGHEPP
jgi:hypothetical protein